MNGCSAVNLELYEEWTCVFEKFSLAASRVGSALEALATPCFCLVLPIRFLGILRILKSLTNIYSLLVTTVINWLIDWHQMLGIALPFQLAEAYLEPLRRSTCSCILRKPLDMLVHNTS